MHGERKGKERIILGEGVGKLQPTFNKFIKILNSQKFKYESIENLENPHLSPEIITKTCSVMLQITFSRKSLW